MTRTARRQPDPTRSTTLAQARRGLFIDFESLRDAPPALVGVLCEDSFQQTVLVPSLASAARAKCLRTRSLRDVVGELLDRSLREERLIFAYSSHEAAVVARHTEHGKLFASRYRDARKIARRWCRTAQPGTRLRGFGLTDFERLVGYERPRNTAVKKAAKRLRAVATQLDERGRYALLTPCVKGQWTNLLEYNRLDCEGMRAVVLHALGDVETPGSARSRRRVARREQRTRSARSVRED